MCWLILCHSSFKALDLDCASARAGEPCNSSDCSSAFHRVGELVASGRVFTKSCHWLLLACSTCCYMIVTVMTISSFSSTCTRNQWSKLCFARLACSYICIYTGQSDHVCYRYTQCWLDRVSACKVRMHSMHTAQHSSSSSSSSSV